MSGSRARTSGNTDRANQRTASAFGGWRNPPTNTRSRRSSNGSPGRRRGAGWTARRPPRSGASRASNARSASLTTSVTSLRAMTPSSAARVRRAAALQRGIAGQRGGTLLAQVMQVHGVEDDRRLRRMPAHERQEFAGDIMATEHHRIEAPPVFAQPAGRALRERRVPRLRRRAAATLRCGGRHVRGWPAGTPRARRPRAASASG